MARFPSFAGRTSSVAAAPALLFAQHFAVLLAYLLASRPLITGADIWLLPLRRLAFMPDLPTWAAALAFVLSLLVAFGLALLSFRRATWSGGGYLIAALAIVPGVQVAAIVLLAALPRFGRKQEESEPESDPGTRADVAHIVQGVLAGFAIIVLAVLVSAVTFGAYGCGLFVMTPLLVGIATGYLANRRKQMSSRRTTLVVLAAAALGTVALVMVALEGLMCILLAAPLGAVVAAIAERSGARSPGRAWSRAST